MNRRRECILLLHDEIGKLCQKIGLVLVTHKCWDYVRRLFDVICEVIRLILRRRSPAPESGNSIKIGLIVHYVCTK